MRRTPVEALITYASFLALSVVVHMVVILGGRAARAPGEAPAPAPTPEPTTVVAEHDTDRSADG